LPDHELAALAAEARAADPLRRLAQDDPAGYARLRARAGRVVDERHRTDLQLEVKVMKHHADPGAAWRLGFADLFGGTS
jgi:hypothetical protein